VATVGAAEDDLVAEPEILVLERLLHPGSLPNTPILAARCGLGHTTEGAGFAGLVGVCLGSAA
jgi:hypothetical protein